MRRWLDSLSLNTLQLPNVSISIPNILAGAVLGVVSFASVLFLPVLPSSWEEPLPQSSFSSLEKPVVLFEDILRDLQSSYVDDLDVNKLFETAMSSMLKSLDPYTEFENLESSRNMQESVSGRYGGVGLVISSVKSKPQDSKEGGPPPAAAPKADTEPAGFAGVTVMDAFEGYAFDGGMRVGDRLLSIGGVDASRLSVEQARDLLRGEPETDVVIRFERDDFPGRSTREAVLHRKMVRMSDVRLATFIGDPADGVGYINLSGFNSGSGRDFGTALLLLRMNAPHDLKALVLDLRGNPGGLLDAAVEVASYLLPPKSEIVSQVGKDGVQLVYKSVIDPIRPAGTSLAVLVNSGSASAAEIVAGAVQDTDAGVVLGSSKTFGKGLVQKIVPLPYDSALKYTIAKYYTPSGRCIQAINYKGGRADGEGKGAAAAEESAAVLEKDRKLFYTSKGRAVRDGGGIEPDLLLPTIRAGPAESIFLGKGVYFDFISEYVKENDALSALRALPIAKPSAQNVVLSSPPRISTDPNMFPEFKKFVAKRVSSRDLVLEDAFAQPIKELEKSLADAGLKDVAGDVQALKQRAKDAILRDMDAHKAEIMNDLELVLLSRELPDRLVLQRNMAQDAQVKAAVQILANKQKYLALLAPSEAAPPGPPSERDFKVALADE